MTERTIRKPVAAMSKSKKALEFIQQHAGALTSEKMDRIFREVGLIKDEGTSSPPGKDSPRPPKGAAGKMAELELLGLVEDGKTRTSLLNGIEGSDALTIVELFMSLEDWAKRGRFPEVLMGFDALIKIMEELKPRENSVKQAKALRSLAGEIVGKIERAVLSEERQDLLAHSAEVSGAGKQEEQAMEPLRKEYQRSTERPYYARQSRVNKKVMSFWLPEDLVTSIKDLATIRGRSIQEVLEEAMRDMVAKNAAPLEKYQAVMRELKKG